MGRDPSEISFGAYVNVGCHPDLDVARGLISGGVAAFAHFSSMPGSTGAGLADADRLHEDDGLGINRRKRAAERHAVGARPDGGPPALGVPGVIARAAISV